MGADRRPNRAHRGAAHGAGGRGAGCARDERRWPSVAPPSRRSCPVLPRDKMEREGVKRREREVWEGAMIFSELELG